MVTSLGGTNPTMINALDLNCQILALDTVFSREMLENKKSIFFSKNENSIVEKICEFESKYDDLIKKNNYTFPKKYDWDCIAESYIEAFNSLLFDKKRKS